MKLLASALLAATILAAAAPSSAGTITEFSSRSAFNAAVGPVFVDDYGTEVAVYDNVSVTRGPVTYTGLNTAFSEIATQNPFLIGAPNDQKLTFRAGEAIGGFPTLELTFDVPISAFGFDSAGIPLDRTLSLLISFTDGTSSLFSLAGTRLDTFFAGFESSSRDIAAVQFYQTNRVSSFVVQLDNFAIDTTDVPEPASLGLISLGFLALALRRRRVE